MSIYAAPIGKQLLRYRILSALQAAWRKIDRRDPWRHWQPLGYIDDTLT